ncbi:hypothetical protein AAY473_004962 [Plecturocebus cupreus]
MGAHPARKQPPAARGRFHTLDPPLARPIRSLRHGQHGGHYHSGGERSRQPARERAPAAGTRFALSLPPYLLPLPSPPSPAHPLSPRRCRPAGACSVSVCSGESGHRRRPSARRPVLSLCGRCQVRKFVRAPERAPLPAPPGHPSRWVSRRKAPGKDSRVEQRVCAEVREREGKVSTRAPPATAQACTRTALIPKAPRAQANYSHPPRRTSPRGAGGPSGQSARRDAARLMPALSSALPSVPVRKSSPRCGSVRPRLRGRMLRAAVRVHGLRLPDATSELEPVTQTSVQLFSGCLLL